MRGSNMEYMYFGVIKKLQELALKCTTYRELQAGLSSQYSRLEKILITVISNIKACHRNMFFAISVFLKQ